MKHDLAAFSAGILFGFGLAYSGMTDTHKIIGFLDIFGNWDYDLAFVMGGALAVSILSFRLMKDREFSLIECAVKMPSKAQIDTKLIAGAALFGIGWGLFGYCPGPGITALIYLDPVTYLFVASMIAGIIGYKYLNFSS